MPRLGNKPCAQLVLTNSLHELTRHIEAFACHVANIALSIQDDYSRAPRIVRRR